MQKTNAMRILDKEKIVYEVREYAHNPGQAVDGITVARLTGEDPAAVFKTLVLRGAKEVYVFVLPVSAELDLKKAAKCVSEKSVSMVPVREIQALTGYVRGGCSPVGMRKRYKTIYHQSAAGLSHIMVSGGKIGLQIKVMPQDLIRVTDGTLADIEEGR